MANILVNAPEDGQARRGRRDQGADPASHGDRLPARPQRPHHPAQHHRALHRDLERHRDLRMEMSPAIAANPFVSFFAVATESGTVGPALDRRRGLRRRGAGRHRRRMTGCGCLVHRSGARLRRLLRGGAGRRRQAPLRLPGHGRGAAEDAGRRHRQSRHALRPARQPALGQGRRRRRQVLRRLPWRRRRQHEGRRRALSRHPARAATRRSISRAASISAAPSNQKADRLPPEKPRAAGAHRLCRAPVARPADRAAGRSAARRLPRAGRGDLSAAARASSTCPAPSATTTMPARSWRASTIPEAHPTGYPIYRLEWQALGSLKRRLRNCLVGIRAEPCAYDAPEYVALDLFLMERARGMMLESPGVRP